ncbi:hypothetical protein HF086_018217 [Spodoptera exigua]|uniref:Peptidase aspartic putative domain-containing protein n=1 Tax=Spodoptera exigua TaxID=7107 RepID=A0A922MLN7_SPOEX|nr:hypothetical protein HF086_018217 [Spodoptera exigua]
MSTKSDKADMEVTREISELIKKRSSYKGRITIFSGFLKSLDTSAITSKDISEIEMRLESSSNSNATSFSSGKCPKCSEDHKLNNCPQFLALSNEARLQLLPSFKVCFNCFCSGHYANHCKKPGCKLCKRRHNTLIHVADTTKTKPVVPSGRTDNNNIVSSSPPATSTDVNPSLTLSASVAASCHQVQGHRVDVLLSTVLIKLYDSNNREHLARAILDSGSTSCLMTDKMYRQLNLPYTPINKSIMGINSVASQINKMCLVSLKSLDETFMTNLRCFVLPSITNNVPCHSLDISTLNIPSDVCLADPYFHTPASVDFIIGADIFWDILGSQRLDLGAGKPTLYETKLGWIVSGPLVNSNATSLPNTICNLVQLDAAASNSFHEQIQHQLERFWSLEDVTDCSATSPEYKLCEDHFMTNTTRLPDGRFCLGIECDDERISEIITHDFYVDDLLSGGDDLSDVKNMRDRLTSVLASACFPLRKWQSNEPQLVSELAHSSRNLNIGGNEPSKTLGLGWQAVADELCFPTSHSIAKTELVCTKRSMLSIISQIFDPLGLVSPVVISLKMLLQKLWLHKLSWDEPLTPDIESVWSDVIKKLHHLNNICVPRRVIIDSFKRLEFHVFSDASERAYGACLYVRSINESGKILVRLLVSKSRVAPIKATTIPRLELCGALVGARLYNKVVKSLRVKAASTVFWTDSTILLGWLKMLPFKLHTFVRNRIGEILDLTGDCVWRHVPTEYNPADYISRGVSVESIQALDMWWSGPSFLKEPEVSWPLNSVNMESLPEMREFSCVAQMDVIHNVNNFIQFNRFYKFNRLRRAVAYMLRFIDACRRRPLAGNYLSEVELRNALNVIIRVSQMESFS